MKPSSVIFILATVLAVTAYNLHWIAPGLIAPELPDPSAWQMKFLSLAYLGWLWSFEFSLPDKRRGFKAVVWVVMWWAGMNAFDEWLGNPYDTKTTEYFIAGFGILTGWMRYKQITIKGLLTRARK